MCLCIWRQDKQKTTVEEVNVSVSLGKTVGIYGWKEPHKSSNQFSDFRGKGKETQRG